MEIRALGPGYFFFRRFLQERFFLLASAFWPRFFRFLHFFFPVPTPAPKTCVPEVVFGVSEAAWFENGW